MSTRISAEEARQKTELAKQQAEINAKIRADKKTEAEARKKERDKARKLINVGWEAQRILLIDAAVEGKSHLVLEPPIFRYHELVELDFIFSEEGWVRNQDFYDGWVSFDLGDFAVNDPFASHEDNWDLGNTIEDSNHPLVQKLKKYRSNIDSVLVQFGKSAYPDVQQYYRFDEFSRILKKELAVALESRSSLFHRDHVIWAYVPIENKKHYERHFDQIDQAISIFRKLKGQLEEGHAPPRFHQGEYSYTVHDKKIDVIDLPGVNKDRRSAKNTFSVWWGTGSDSAIFNAELFCRAGLSWLSRRHGQKLLDEIFKALEEAANKGSTSLTLHFVLPSDDQGWYFKRSSGSTFESCSPDDLVEIIERRGFTIDDTQSFYGSYKIRVSW